MPKQEEIIKEYIELPDFSINMPSEVRLKTLKYIYLLSSQGLAKTTLTDNKQTNQDDLLTIEIQKQILIDTLEEKGVLEISMQEKVNNHLTPNYYNKFKRKILTPQEKRVI